MHGPDHEVANWSSYDSMVNRIRVLFNVVDMTLVTRWLDVGCGPGTAFKLARKYHIVKYGIDVFPTVFTECGAHMVVADCEALPFRDSTFDLVSSIGVLQTTWLHYDIVVSELVRMSSGLIFLTALDYNWGVANSTTMYLNNWHTPDEVVESVRRAGANIADVGWFDPHGRCGSLPYSFYILVEVGGKYDETY